MIFSQSATSNSKNLPNLEIPALLIKISIDPKPFFNVSIAVVTSSYEETSAVAITAFTPSASTSFATAFKFSSERAKSPTFTPSFANAIATARPIPLPAPVIKAFLPCNNSAKYNTP